MPVKDHIEPAWPRRVSTALASFALLGGAVSFGGWALDIPRLTDWAGDDISIQPNAAVLVALAGAALLLLCIGWTRLSLGIGALVALAGGLTLLQHVVGADFGFNHQLLFGRSWGGGATLTPGRMGPPASFSFLLIGSALVILSLPGSRAGRARGFVPAMALTVAVLMTFSLIGYVFDARSFYSIPWLSAIALQTAAMLMALAMALLMNVADRQPMLTLRESSGAGAMARTVIPVLVIMPVMVSLLRSQGEGLGYYDEGTGRALAAVVSIFIYVGLMWWALLALRRREQHDREADKRKDEFLAMLAHELRNPLAPIRNAVAMLEMEDGDPAAVRRAAGMMGRQLAQLVRLIDDLLDVSRISQGKLELRRERVDLGQVVQQAVETCRPAVQAANHVLEISLPPEPVQLDADPVRLSQVISNLLSNACKFTPAGGRITLSAERERGEIVIRVRDNGIGIPPERLDSVFEMFSQIDKSLERSQGGLGIGLNLTRWLVELHGGRIDGRSDGAGKGSEFVVYLPVANGEAAAPAGPHPEPDPAVGHRILVVDDNRESAQSLAMLLRLTGNETFTAYDGEQAIEMAASQRPDVILMDIGLPKLNGYDACRQIRRQPGAQHTVIIALTGWGKDEDRRRSAEAGFNHHLVKPVEHAALMKVLADLGTGGAAAARA